VIRHIVRSADFERVLGTPIRARSVHFAVHHLVDVPMSPRKTVIHQLSTELSTASRMAISPAVDDSHKETLATNLWLGAVVPRRHAKRAVTRSLLKRQIRAAAERNSCLPGGLWVVRLRAPFDRSAFSSAASDALRQAARDELDQLLADAVRRVPGRSK